MDTTRKFHTPKPANSRKHVMAERALYACDQCVSVANNGDHISKQTLTWCQYRCKTRCDKQLPACGRCTHQNATCTYSVTGVESINTASSSSSSNLDLSSRHDTPQQRSIPDPTYVPITDFSNQNWAAYTGDGTNVWSENIQAQPVWVGSELDRDPAFLMPTMDNTVGTSSPSLPNAIAQLEPGHPTIPMVDLRSAQGSRQAIRNCRCIQAILEASTIASRELDTNNGVDPPNMQAVREAASICCHAPKCCMLTDTATFMSIILFIQKAAGCVRLAIQFPSTITIALEMRMRMLTMLTVMDGNLASEDGFPELDQVRRAHLKNMIEQLQIGLRSCHWSSGEESYY